MTSMRYLPGLAWTLVVAAISLNSCATKTPLHLRNLSGPGIDFQEKKSYTFRKNEIEFSNEFPSARMNDVKRLNDSTYQITILAENKPINSSPWYAFRIWSPKTQNIRIVLDYEGTKHRYTPKIKHHQGEHWTELKADVPKDRLTATFSVPLQGDTVWVSAQPFFNKDSIVHWLGNLEKLPHVTMREIGRSILDQPILGYHTTPTTSKKAIVLLGGQHPPEITGYTAQVAFVDFILGNDPRAVAFRQEYQVVGVPWINPDGNNLGNWRHNVAGVDLNRDWTTFLQPETRATRDFLLSFKTLGVVYEYASDFHSTHRDILYTNNIKSDALTNHPGLMDRWIERWNEKLGELEVPVRPSDPNGRVSKSWLYTELGAEAVTYEVADKTPFEEIRYKAEQAAIALIEVLMD